MCLKAVCYPVIREVVHNERRAERSSRVNATPCEADLWNKEEEERDRWMTDECKWGQEAPHGNKTKPNKMYFSFHN